MLNYFLTQAMPTVICLFVRVAAAILRAFYTYIAVFVHVRVCITRLFYYICIYFDVWNSVCPRVALAQANIYYA